MPYKVTLIPGDGIGPEVTRATVRALEATGVRFEWEPVEAGDVAQEKHGTPLPDNVCESIRRNKVALKGPITTPVGYGFKSVNVRLRRALDLYACLRPCRHYRGIPSRYQGLDLVVVRENTEDVYSGIEFEKGSKAARQILDLVRGASDEEVRPDSGISLKTISESGSRRIVRFAFEYARRHGRKKVTAVHKANIMKFTDGLFLEVSREVAAGYPDIEFEDQIVDAMCMRLVQKPEQFDVMVLPNLYGDIISDLCAGLVGGLGTAPGANIGDDFAVFEATHGSAPKYTGQNKVNPMAMMLSGVLMLRYLGEEKAADCLDAAISKIIAEGRELTYDLMAGNHPPVGTSQVADAVIREMGKSSA